MGKRSPKAIRTALKGLQREATVFSNDHTKALDSAYKHAMERIEGQIGDQTMLAKQVLSWIIYARRPLTTSELRHALAVEIGEFKLDEENLPEIDDMVSTCAGLVTVDEQSDVIRLVHYTTQDYLERTWTAWFPNAQTEITKICVTSLSFNAFETGFCLKDEEFEAREQSNTLYNYAASHWGNHARGDAVETDQMILDFLESEAKVAASSQAITVPQDY
jgi:hypothetical protein